MSNKVELELLRRLDAMAKERDDALADIETLELHIETLREAWQGASEAVTKLGEQLNASEADCERFGRLLDDCRDLLITQYDPDDNITMIHRIEEALGLCNQDSGSGCTCMAAIDRRG